jgi:hypothetical protein
MVTGAERNTKTDISARKHDVITNGVEEGHMANNLVRLDTTSSYDDVAIGGFPSRLLFDYRLLSRM